MYSFLTMTAGEQIGRAFLLKPEGENRLGRSRDCQIQVADPLCSRVHAVMVRDRDAWRIRDGKSRNGTYVNGRPVHDALLRPEDSVRIGATEFAFHEADDLPSALRRQTDESSEAALVRQAAVGAAELPASSEAVVLPSQEQWSDLLLLHQLALRLLERMESGQAVRLAIELLRERTGASRVAYLSVDAAGTLVPMLVLPEDASTAIHWNAALARLVTHERSAVWTAAQRTARRGARADEPTTDALCVPLVCREQVLGALHVDLERGNFQQAHFEFAISVANMTAAAIARDSAAAAALPSDATLNLRDWEQRLIQTALDRTSGNVPAAAKLLGIGRATLYRKIEEYGLREPR